MLTPPLVLYDSAHDPSKVALICGGGAGHEPAHAGYVGEQIPVSIVEPDHLLGM